ncbi:MAG: amidohydrolase family protein [Sulfurifustaceae bacterium]
MTMLDTDTTVEAKDAGTPLSDTSAKGRGRMGPRFDFKQFDCDSHVQETGNSWELYLDEAFRDRRPRVIDNSHVSQRPERNKTWYIDGRLVPKNQGAGGVVMSTPAEMDFAKSKPVPVEVQACTDPIQRADFMRRAGVDRTVLFSTLFLETLTDDLVYEAALMRAWNDWMADMCRQAPDTLQFAALVPIRDPHLAVREMLHARERGAATVMILPTAGERMLHDPLLDPFWSEAQNMNMPVSVHIGWPNPRVTNECTSPASIFLGAFDTSVWWGYLSFLAGGIFDRFKHLKVAFMEHDARFFEVFLARAMHWYPTAACKPWPAKKSPEAYLRDHAVYFSFEGDYAFMPEFLEIAGPDRVMGAFDFPHTHYGVASISASFDFMRDHDGLSDEMKRKVLHDNCAAFYGFTD